jgi:hypothetical protein
MNSTASSPQSALPFSSALAEENALLREQLDAQSDVIRQLKHQLDWFKKQLFGPKSEKQVFDLPQQGPLFSSDQAVVSVARLTHSSNVCGTQPILGAIDSTATHSDGCSPRCSCTSRTARSLTSGENLFDLFMAPFSQMLEPPQNPGRFSNPSRSPAKRIQL